ncbi:hypothetical protein ACPC54_25085 [Kitasatospora sp. NPDC094028]
MVAQVFGASGARVLSGRHDLGLLSASGAGGEGWLSDVVETRVHHGDRPSVRSPQARGKT